MWSFIYVLTLNLANVVTRSTSCNDPVGILLCQINCRQVQGCDQYRLDSNNLQCCIGAKGKDQLNESAFWMIMHMTKTPPVSTKHCAKGFRIFQTRKNRSRCLPTERKSVTPDRPRDHPPECPRDRPRDSMLFTYTEEGYSNDMFLINLASEAVCFYRESNVSRISTMVFNKLTNTLYYASKQERSIKKTTLGTSKRDLVLATTIVNAMALDEAKEILFMSERMRDKFRIGMFHLKSKVYKQIVGTQQQSDSIAVVPKQRKIYNSITCCIIAITYEGKQSVEIFRQGRVPGVLAVNPTGNILYYSRERDFNVYDLTSDTGSFLWQTDLPALVTGIEIHRGRIFVTLTGGKVCIIREDKGKYVVTPGSSIRFSDFESDVLAVIV